MYRSSVTRFQEECSRRARTRRRDSEGGWTGEEGSEKVFEVAWSDFAGAFLDTIYLQEGRKFPVDK